MPGAGPGSPWDFGRGTAGAHPRAMRTQSSHGPRMIRFGRPTVRRLPVSSPSSPPTSPPPGRSQKRSRRSGPPGHPLEGYDSELRYTRRRGGWRGVVALLGPAFVAAVAYIDPGNFATNVAGGARFGYLLVWVVVLA